MMTEAEMKEILTRMLVALFPGVKIYLFGSFARGTHKDRSDIDISLDMGRKLSNLEIVKANNIVEALNIPRKVDIVDFNRAPDYLRDVILKEGIPWSELT